MLGLHLLFRVVGYIIHGVYCVDDVEDRLHAALEIGLRITPHHNLW